MRAKIYSFNLVLCIYFGFQPNEMQVNQEDSLQIKVASYNVEYSTKGSATEIGKMLAPYNFDIVCFSEAPGGDWTKEVAEVMGLDHVVIGRYSTAGHDDKYKTIASRTPLYGYEEILMADTLHTVTKASTKIDGQEIAIYSVHFPFGWRDQAHIDETTSKVKAFVDYLKDKKSNEAIPVIMGDFNFTLSNTSYISPYYEMFVEIGFDASWPDLGIDVSQLGTMVKFNPEENNRGKVIDHIMYNSTNTRALEGQIIEMENPLSDHKPVWALLQINKN